MQDQMALPGGQDLRLEFPAAHPHWLPRSLTALRLECPTLGALPGCLSTLSALAALEINTRSMLSNAELILHHTGEPFWLFILFTVVAAPSLTYYFSPSINIIKKMCPAAFPCWLLTLRSSSALCALRLLQP